MFRSPLIKTCLIAALALTTSYHATLAQMIEIDGEVFRDPTQPANVVYQDIEAASIDDVSRMSLSSFNLSFVRSGGLNPVAVINNRTVSVGDEIEGVIVAAIRPGAVVLMIEGEEQVLNLFGKSVRQAIE